MFVALLGLILLLSALFISSAAEAAERQGRPSGADFYVSTEGSDAWSGTLAEPNPARTDGPFATIHRAQKALRSVRALGGQYRDRPWRVWIRGGIYYLAEPLVLTAEDSGTAQAPVMYEAYPGEHPILSGGKRITWDSTNRNRWRAVLPDVAEGKWMFSQLWVEGQRRYRPRLPKYGFYYVAEETPPENKAQASGYDAFKFAPGEISADWQHLNDIEIAAFQIWTMARLRIKEVDAASQVVRFTGTTRGTTSYSALAKGNRYLVINVREALTDPGEWYLDRKTGELTYLPMPGEQADQILTIAPVLDRLVEFKADMEGRKWVSHIVLSDLTFAHTNWNSPPEGNAFPQAEAHLPGAIAAQGARNCRVEDCRIAHTGQYALEIGAGCKNVSIKNCTMHDLAAGGVKIGQVVQQPDDELVASHIVVEQCTISTGGRLHPAAVGVWIGNAHHNRISNNDIFDFYYTGVSVGWSWGYGKSLAHHNIIANNHIHTIGQGVLSDMGGIYTLGISPGSVLRHNRIHDVMSFGYGGWGIYFDEGTTGMIAENNLVYRCKSATFHQHYGKENILRNNVFAMGSEFQLMRTRAEEHLSFTFTRNIVYYTQGKLLGSNWGGEGFRLDSNVYWTEGGDVQFEGLSLDEWRTTRGQDRRSIVADPLFANPGKGDFTLQKGSPVDQIGFIPVSPEGIGRTSGSWFPAEPERRAFPPPGPTQ